MSLAIRPALADDRQALSRICLLTANAGTDASDLYADPEYPGLVWSVPYLQFAPENCFVLADGQEVVGYVVGTPDTATYERRLDEAWWPVLADKYTDRTTTGASDSGVLDRIREPRYSDPGIIQAYPAHLHINLLPQAQSGGWGRRMIETELDSLRKSGAPAVHLGLSLTNDRALGFYQHLGFSEIGRGEAIWMGMDLQDKRVL